MQAAKVADSRAEKDAQNNCKRVSCHRGTVWCLMSKSQMQKSQQLHGNMICGGRYSDTRHVTADNVQFPARQQ